MTKPSPEDLEFEEIRAEIPLRHKIKKKKVLFIYFWLCWVFLAASGGSSLVAVYSFLFATASLVTEHDL